MIKVVVIPIKDNCSNGCPYMRERFIDNVCTHPKIIPDPGRIGRMLDSQKNDLGYPENPIPDWCPLETGCMPLQERE